MKLFLTWISVLAVTQRTAPITVSLMPSSTGTNLGRIEKISNTEHSAATKALTSEGEAIVRDTAIPSVDTSPTASAYTESHLATRIQTGPINSRALPLLQSRLVDNPEVFKVTLRVPMEQKSEAGYEALKKQLEVAIDTHFSNMPYYLSCLIEEGAQGGGTFELKIFFKPGTPEESASIAITSLQAVINIGSVGSVMIIPGSMESESSDGSSKRIKQTLERTSESCADPTGDTLLVGADTDMDRCSHQKEAPSSISFFLSCMTIVLVGLLSLIF